MTQPQTATNERAPRSVEVATSIISALLALLALALIPWMGLAVPSGGRWLLLWGALEGSWLIPLVPGLFAGSPPVVRATMRDAQIGVLGRALLWLASSAGFALSTDWSFASLPAHALALLGAAFALPAALIWGPFGPLPGVLDARDAGLDAATVRLARLIQHLRSAVLVVAMLVFVLPVALLPTVAALSLLVSALLLIWLAFGRLVGYWPQLTLIDALRICWMRALPLGLAAIIYIAVLAASRR